jgi:hypothetical protein
MEISTHEAVDFLERNFKYVTLEERMRLANKLKVSYSPENESFKVGDPIDILTEVQEQMQMVRLIRQKVMSSGANPKEMQSLVSTTTSLFAMLTKHSDAMVNQDRIKKIEAAVVEAIKELPPPNQEIYFTKLTELLSE